MREQQRSRDAGFTLVEVLIVIVILGIISTVVVFAVRGFSSRGEDSACGSDTRTLVTAAEVYFAQQGVNAVPPTGAGGDRFERTLVDAGLLKQVSTKYDMAADGTVTSNGAPC